MTMIADHLRSVTGPRVFSRQEVMRRIGVVLARRGAARKARATARSLSEHNDAALADIGLTRADLTPMGVDHAIDRQADAMLRVYR